MNIVTFSDQNYLCKCLTLHSSISKFTKNFKFYYLCLDDKTFEVAKNIENCIALHVNTLSDQDLSLISRFNKSPNSFSLYHFALSPYVCNLFSTKYNLEEFIYCDSDIYFTDNINLISESCKNYDIGLSAHKHISKNSNKKAGFYNVGVLYFKVSEQVKSVLKFWLDSTINKDNIYYKSHGTCGDQKYLELFEILYPDLKIKLIDDDVGHLAPWCCEVVRDIKKYEIIWDGKRVYNTVINKTQKLVFFHFSHFGENYSKNKYDICRKDEWNVYCIQTKFSHLYDEYFQELKNNKTIYNI